MELSVMKRSVFVTLFLGALTLASSLPSEGQAFGKRHRGGDCATPCASDCAAPVCAPVAPVAPQMVPMTVTRYKETWKERQITENVTKVVPRQEKFNYFVSVPVTREEARKVT